MRSDEPGFRGATPVGDFDARTGTASGSDPSRTAPPDEAVPSVSTGIPGVGTVMPLAAQAGTGEGASPQQPGQNEGFPGGDPGYSSTGASGSDSHTDAWTRKSGQQTRDGGTA